MKRVVYIAFLAGLTLFTMLVAYQGVTQVASALAMAGWGLLVVVLFHFIPMTADGLSWYVLLDPTSRPRFRTILWARWIGESVDTLLPVAQIGGELVKTRLLTHYQVPGSQAGASVVVNLTLAVFTQVIFTLVGLVLLTLLLGEGKLAQGILAVTAFSSLSIVGFYWFQQRGLFGWLARRFETLAGGRNWLALVGGADALDTAVIQLYHQRRQVFRSTSWMLLGWLLGAGEVWLALYFLDHPVGWIEALMIESLAQAVKGAAFLVPGALGVLEGGYILLGSLIGLPYSTSLALALTRRVRELCLGVPGLLMWQFMEGKRLWRQTKSAQERLSIDTSLSN
ncbi:HpnL family protein [Nitrosococcus wardiae]|uniref:HpnL family protein n=1 Tax=Nitrosococcus wardiae TaxID=1814290 RepID=A0A4P7C2R6_9GAMM|nr:HpnL family protein [Nitrosococcus wardiae]QBQ56039.1 HpnL family protein [Nitrosococcus wardiae]